MPAKPLTKTKRATGMKVITIFKWARNPLDARVRADASVEWQGVKLAPGDDDTAVLEIGKKVAQGGEIIALTIGDGDTAWAAARGAGKTVVVSDADSSLNAAVTGKILAAAVQRLGADIVLIGDSVWDYAVVSALAGELGWPALAGVVAAEAVGESLLQVTQKAGSVSWVLDIKGQALIAAAATQEEKNAPGMKDVLAARKKPVEKLTLAELGITLDENLSARGTRFPDTPPAHLIDGSNPAAACAELLNALAADGVL
jgi:electron transfer flavoprotein beta subunit